MLTIVTKKKLMCVAETMHRVHQTLALFPPGPTNRPCFLTSPAVRWGLAIRSGQWNRNKGFPKPNKGFSNSLPSPGS